MMDFSKITKEVLEAEARELLSIDTSRIDWQGMVQAILESKGKLIITGVGKSGLVGKKIAATLASTGTPSFFFAPYRGDAWGFGHDRGTGYCASYQLQRGE